MLTDLGLGTAVRGAALRSTVAISLHELPDRRVDEAAETTAYYVFAEAVANAQKHAYASSIDVSIAFRDRALHVEVADDGAGGASEQSSGLQGLRDRVETIGGSFRVTSPRGVGTVVTATIPASFAEPAPTRARTLLRGAAAPADAGGGPSSQP